MKFAVNICVYFGDEPILFEKVLLSILEQSLLPNTLVLSQDGPISKELHLLIQTYREIFEMKSISFLWVVSDINMGHGYARNNALQSTIEDYLILCDSDDINLPNKFSEVISGLEQGFDSYGGQIIEVDFNKDINFGKRIVFTKHEDICKDLKRRCPMNLTTCGFKVSSLKSVGGFGQIPFNEDYELWIKFVTYGYRMGNSTQILVNVSVNEDYFYRRGGYVYFKSEFKVQKLLYINGLINLKRLIINSSLRFILQVLSPNIIRKWLFSIYARK